VLSLWYIGFWELALLKDTVLWFTFSGVFLIFRLVGDNENDSTFYKIVNDHLKIIVLVQFLANSYTFSLRVEIFLVPALALVILIDAVARTDERYLIVNRLTTSVIVLLVLLIIVFATFKAIGDVGNLVSTFTLRKLLLTPVLSMLLIPWINVVRVYLAYEAIFVRLSIGSTKTRSLNWYARRRLMTHFHINLRKLLLFHKSNPFALMDINCRSDVDQLLEEFESNL